MYTVADILITDVVADARVLDSDQTISVDLSLWEAAEKLAAAGRRALPVVQDGRVIGVIRRADLVHALQKLGAPD
jgi:CBS domain-containing protein